MPLGCRFPAVVSWVSVGLLVWKLAVQQFQTRSAAAIKGRTFHRRSYRRLHTCQNRKRLEMRSSLANRHVQDLRRSAGAVDLRVQPQRARNRMRPDHASGAQGAAWWRGAALLLCPTHREGCRTTPASAAHADVVKPHQTRSCALESYRQGDRCHAR